jgi:hypothetical protein
LNGELEELRAQNTLESSLFQSKIKDLQEEMNDIKNKSEVAVRELEKTQELLENLRYANVCVCDSLFDFFACSLNYRLK